MDLQSLMEKEWRGVRKSFHYPQIPYPILTEDIPNAQVDFSNLQISINPQYVQKLAQQGSPEELSLNALLGHEVGHYCEYPGSVLDLLHLHKVARQTLNENEALAVREAFLNVQNNTNLFQRRGYESIPVALKAMAKDVEKDPLNNLVHGTYQELWEKDLGIKLKRKEQGVAERLKEIPYLDKERQEYSLQQFIELTKDYLKDANPPQSSFSSFSDDDLREGIRQFAQESSPGEFEQIMQEILKEIKGEGEKEEHQRPYEKQQGHGRTAGIGEGVISIAENFYSALAENFSVPIRKKPIEKNGSLYPHSHEEFSMDDSMNDFDPFSSPGIVPGITQKWIRKEGEVTTSYHGIPDSLIVIDSSGSMPDPSKGISVPVLGGTVVANAYLRNQGHVTVYNFSGTDIIIGPSQDKSTIHEAIRTYQNGGTTFTPEKLEDIVKKQTQIDMSIISDTDISNLESFVSSLSELPSVHRIHLLYTNPQYIENVKRIATKLKHKKNIAILPLYSQEDIHKITLGELTKSIK